MSAERSTSAFQRRNKTGNTQIAIIRRFWRRLSVISIPFLIFRRLYALFTPFYMQEYCTRFPASKRAQELENRSHSLILTKIKRYFFPVSDISTLKRYFHCIISAERSTSAFQRRNKTGNTQIAIIRRFWRRLSVISLPFLIFRRLNDIFTELWVQNLVHASSSVETSPDASK